MNERQATQLQIAVNLAVWSIAIVAPWVLVVWVARWMA